MVVCRSSASGSECKSWRAVMVLGKPKVIFCYAAFVSVLTGFGKNGFCFQRSRGCREGLIFCNFREADEGKPGRFWFRAYALFLSGFGLLGV